MGRITRARQDGDLSGVAIGRLAIFPVATTAVLFDLDDTLFDHWHGTREALATLRARHKCLRRWTSAELSERHSQVLERLHLEVLGGRMTVGEARIRRFGQLFRDAECDITPHVAAEVATEYREAYEATWRPVPGAVSLLRQLSQHVVIGVITNNLVSEQLQKIRTCGLEPYLDSVTISEEAGVAKPAARAFDIALARLGARAQDTVMVGDAWANDILGARGAGIRAVWFNPLGLPVPEPGVAAELRKLEPVAQAVSIILNDSLMSAQRSTPST